MIVLKAYNIGARGCEPSFVLRQNFYSYFMLNYAGVKTLAKL